jgi:hypothetical protein
MKKFLLDLREAPDYQVMGAADCLSTPLHGYVMHLVPHDQKFHTY